jgi:hypothetical protein
VITSKEHETKTLTVLLLFLALSACAPVPTTPARNCLITATPTLFLVRLSAAQHACAGGATMTPVPASLRLAASRRSSRPS